VLVPFEPLQPSLMKDRSLICKGAWLTFKAPVALSALAAKLGSPFILNKSLINLMG
jgi:hypothetical protein